TTGDVKEAATEVTKGQDTVLGKAIAIYDYIVETGERDPTIEGCGIGDVEALLKNLSGKCADINPVFVAMARSVGVPAREILGTRIAKEGDISGAYHCRTEFYLPGYGWVPVDPSDVLKFHLVNECAKDDPELIEAQQYLFGAQTETYIDFYHGRDVILNPAQDGDKLNYFMYPYAEVDGKPLAFENPGHPVSQEGLEYVVTYEEIVGSTLWLW
ncbi:MAG: transglutaminase-like domain-containing protein, partial [Dehalococcoidales bacterium]